MHVFCFESVDCEHWKHTAGVCASSCNDKLEITLNIYYNIWKKKLKSSSSLRVIGVLGRNVIFINFAHIKAYLKLSEDDLCVQAVHTNLVSQQCGEHVVAMWTCVFHFPSGKRKALKLNFANPPVKPTSRLPLHPMAPSFQNPHMWVKSAQFSVVFLFHFGKQFVLTGGLH